MEHAKICSQSSRWSSVTCGLGLWFPWVDNQLYQGKAVSPWLSWTTVLLIREEKTPNVVRATPTEKQQPMWLLSFSLLQPPGNVQVVPVLVVRVLRLLELQLLFFKIELWQEHFKISHIFQKWDNYSQLLTQQPPQTPELQAQLEPAASPDTSS